MTQNPKDQTEDEGSVNLLPMLENPIKLITSGAIFSLKAGRHLLLSLFVFGFVNFILTGYALFHFFSLEFRTDALWGLLLLIAVGMFFTFYATYRAYKLMMLEALRGLYARSAPLVNKIVQNLIARYTVMMNDSAGVNDSQLQKVLDIGAILNEKYGRLPGALRKGLTMLMSRIPLAVMLMQLRPDIESGNTAGAAEQLTLSMDSYLKKHVFGGQSFRVFWILLAINMLIVWVIIRWMIS